MEFFMDINAVLVLLCFFLLIILIVLIVILMLRPKKHSGRRVHHDLDKIKSQIESDYEEKEI